jgi:peptide/nickel transport system substrate-binding protein
LIGDGVATNARRARRFNRTPAILSVVALLLMACTSGRPASTAPGAAPGTTSPASASKTLTMATTREPPFIVGFTGGGTTGGSGDIKNILHNTLSVLGEDGTYLPQLAADEVSLDKGTWRLNPDNSMDIVWNLRSNIKWQDGTPFTSADMLFTFKVMKDKDLPTPAAGVLNLMDSATAPDPQTFIVHWSQPYVWANGAEGLDPLPKHLLEPLYEGGDKDAFVNSTYLTTEWVGLGPYKMDRWIQGSEMDLVQFDDYFQGRPAVDRVIIRFIGDPNTIVAAALAGAVDVVYPPGVDFDNAVNIKNQWQGTGNTVRFDSVDANGRVRLLENQFRPELMEPREALSNPAVRQALYRAIDRPTMIEIITHGLTPVADSWIQPSDARRKALEDDIPKFPYDPTRAQQQLAEAGWRAGADGILTHTASGERFQVQLRASQVGGAQVGKERELTVVADNWKRIGVDSTLNLQAVGARGDRGYEAVQPGVADVGNMAPLTNLFRRLNAKYIATEGNRWTGNNLTGYNDPLTTSLLDRYYVAIDPQERLGLDRQLLQKIIGEVVVMPLYWEVVPTLITNGVDASLANPLHIHDFYKWTKQ